MKIYRIEMMDEDNYGKYLSGEYNYSVYRYDVEAETKEQALAIAKTDNPTYYLNKNFVREVDEVKYTTTEKDRIIAQIADLEKRLAQAKENLKNLDKGA